MDSRHKALIDKVRAKRIEQLKNQRKAILDAQRKDIIKVGRDEPCICGSGKKFKKCCINKELL